MLESLSKEAVVQRYFVKKEIKRDSGIGVSFEFCKISKNTFSYRTPPLAASASNTVKCVQALKLATLLKRDPRIGVSEPAVRRSSTK